MTGGPLVSVVMATKNAERYLADALESVRAQTYDRLEVVLVDGRSTDRTLEIAAAYEFVRPVSQMGEGFAGAWNEGVAEARGELVAFLDSDDRWTRDKLRAQVGLLEREPALDYVIGKVQFVLEPGLPPPPGFRPELPAAAHVAPMPGAVLLRRDALDRVGPFGTEWAIASDVDWFARAKDAGLELGVVPEIVLLKRVHDSNLSYFAAGSFNEEVVLLLKRSLDRRRTAGR